jgi:hypothetical protein
MYTDQVPLTEVTYTVQGMSCDHCERAIRPHIGEAGYEVA